MQASAYLRKYLFSLPYNYDFSYKAFYNSKGNITILIVANLFILAAFLDKQSDYLKLNLYTTIISSLVLQLLTLITTHYYKKDGIKGILFKVYNLISQLALIAFFTIIIYNTKEPKTGWWILHFFAIFYIAQLNLFHLLFLLLFSLIPASISTIYIAQNLPHSLYFLSYGYGVSVIATLIYLYQSNLQNNERKIQNKNIKLLKELNKHKMTQEKERISRELHDSLGACLTGNIIYLEIAQDIIDTDIQKTKETLSTIEQLSRDALVKMREVMYSITDEHKFTSSFVEEVKTNAQNLAKIRQLDFSFNCKSKASVESLSLLSKFNINMVITEWFTNIIKHSNASAVFLEFSLDHHRVILSVKDNGSCRKDEIEKVKEGNGIKNIRFRIRELGGRCNIVFSSKGAYLEAIIPSNRS